MKQITVRVLAVLATLALTACNGNITAPLVPTDGRVAPWAVDSSLATPPKADSVITTTPDGIRP